jgi:hypothetical protein
MQWKIDGARPLRSEIEKNSPATIKLNYPFGVKFHIFLE